MKDLLLLPPVTFIMIMLFSILMSFFSAKIFSLKNANNPSGKLRPYACGEDLQSPRVRPDYSQFFPFAFFFTIMHVLALIITTVPFMAVKYSGNAFLYVACALCGLLILFRK